jgi:Ca2+-transporting ATPase
MLIRLIPDSFIRKCIPKYFERKATPEVVIEDAERGGYEWNPALEEIKQELAFIKMVRGGRLNLLRYKLAHPRELLPRSRSGSRSRTSSVNLQTPNNEPAGDGSASIAPPSPDRRSLGRRRGRSRSNSAFGPAAAMAGIVAGSIAGWSPIDRRDGDAFGRFVPLSDRSELEATSGVEVHPDAKQDDPVLAGPEGSLKAPSQPPETSPIFGATLGVPEPGHRRA